MGVNICHFIHDTIQTPLLGEKLRADCLNDCGQVSENVKQRHARDQVEVFVHRIQHDEVEIVAEIPRQSVSLGTSKEIRSDLRPDPNENNEQDVLCPLPTEIVEHFNHCEEKIWNIHGGIYSIPDERKVDAVTPPASSGVNRQVRGFTNQRQTR